MVTDDGSVGEEIHCPGHIELVSLSLRRNPHSGIKQRASKARKSAWVSKQK